MRIFYHPTTTENAALIVRDGFRLARSPFAESRMAAWRSGRCTACGYRTGLYTLYRQEASAVAGVAAGLSCSERRCPSSRAATINFLGSPVTIARMRL
jgi:hypothetical protein